MRTPSLKAIKTFQIAARHSSFAVAADELCITPSAVSHQIKTLETQLGLPLFSRSARALALTDAGARYLEQIDDLFMRLEAVTEQVRARFGRSSVRLHVPAYFASEMLLPRLSEFSKLHDGIDLRIETQGVHGRVHAAEADISVVVGSGPWNQGLIAHPLFAQTMVPACSPELLAEKPVNRYEDLNSHTLLVHEARRDDWDRWACERRHETAQSRADRAHRFDVGRDARGGEEHRHRAAARGAVAAQVRERSPHARVR